MIIVLKKDDMEQHRIKNKPIEEISVNDISYLSAIEILTVADAVYYIDGNECVILMHKTKSNWQGKVYNINQMMVDFV